MPMLRKRRKGFTVVELLIVILMIAILASVGLLSYRTVQAKARDTQRKSDLSQIADAISLYANDKGNFVENCGGWDSDGTGPAAASGTGWFSYTDTFNYPKSIASCLKDGNYMKYLAQDPVTGPNGTSTPTDGYAYMKYDCVIGGTKRSYVFAKLEGGPNGATNPITDPNVCNNGATDTSYGMNYYVEVK